MTDLDQRIASVLREQAEGDVDIDRLTAGAVTGGRRRLRRRRAVLGGGLALVALLGGLAVVPALPGLDRPFTGPAGPAIPAIPAEAAPPLMPAAPGAAAAPEVVGTDAGVLHFGVDTTKVRYLRWEVAQGLESAQLDVGGGRKVTVELARSSRTLRESGAEGVPFKISMFAEEAAFDGRTSSTTVDGLPIQVRQWKPAPGLYARASVWAPQDTALTVAVEALRLTEARRCGAPVRLTTVPDGARVAGCRVDVTGFPRLVTARFGIVGTSTRTMSVSYQYAAEISPRTVDGNMTIAGRPAHLYPEQGRVELLGVPKSRLLADYGWPEQGFDKLDAALVLGGVQVAPDPTRPETWD